MTADTRRIRRLLLAVFAFGIMGTGAELVLLEHYESWQQWLPLALLALGLGAAAAVHRRAGRGSLLALRGIAAAFLLSGALGIYFHLEANVEFERELNPAAGGPELLWEALTGAMPALAPGSMALLGLIGLVITAGHPALQPDNGETDV